MTVGSRGKTDSLGLKKLKRRRFLGFVVHAVLNREWRLSLGPDGRVATSG